MPSIIPSPTPSSTLFTPSETSLKYPKDNPNRTYHHRRSTSGNHPNPGLTYRSWPKEYEIYYRNYTMSIRTTLIQFLREPVNDPTVQPLNPPTSSSASDPLPIATPRPRTIGKLSRSITTYITTKYSEYIIEYTVYRHQSIIANSNALLEIQDNPKARMHRRTMTKNKTTLVNNTTTIWSLETAQGATSTLKRTNNVSPNKASTHQPGE